MNKLETFPTREPESTIEGLPLEKKIRLLWERAKTTEVKETIEKMSASDEKMRRNHPNSLFAEGSAIATRFLEHLIENPEELERLQRV